jgi:hypothetical protein
MYNPFSGRANSYRKHSAKCLYELDVEGEMSLGTLSVNLDRIKDRVRDLEAQGYRCRIISRVPGQRGTVTYTTPRR